MKKIVLIPILFATIFCYAQVGIGTTTPDPSSVLDITSTTKGFLPPRMTYAQKNSIANPATGLIIWCTNCGLNGQLQVFNGTTWTNLAGGAENEPLILDKINSLATVAYSLRRLRFDYTGNCIRVRRSSDNTQQDIGFNSDGTLNTTALLAFVGSGNGFVTTWYDQSGNSNNSIQSSTANQPKVVSSGIVNLVNNKPAIVVDGNDWLPTPIILGRTLYPNASINTVYSYTNASGDHCLWGGDGGSFPRFQLLRFDGGPGIAYGLSNASFASSYSGLLSNSNQNVYSMVSRVGTTNGTNVWVNGTAGTPFTEGTNNGSPSAITLGAIWPGGSYGLPNNSSFQEFFIFTSALTTLDRQTLQSNQGTFYGITIN